MFRKIRLVLLRSSHSKEGLDEKPQEQPNLEKPKSKKKFLGLFHSSSDPDLDPKSKTRKSFLRRKKNHEKERKEPQDETASEILNNHTERLPENLLPDNPLPDQSLPNEPLPDKPLPQSSSPDNVLGENNLAGNSLSENASQKHSLLDENEPFDTLKSMSVSTINSTRRTNTIGIHELPNDQAWKRAHEVWEKNETEETKEKEKEKRRKKGKKEHDKKREGKEERDGKTRTRSKSREKDKEHAGKEGGESKSRSKEKKKHAKHEPEEKKPEEKRSKDDKHKKHKSKSEKHGGHKPRSAENLKIYGYESNSELDYEQKTDRKQKRDHRQRNDLENTHDRTLEHTNMRFNDRTLEHTNNRTHDRTLEHTNIRFNDRTLEHTNIRPHDRTLEHTNNRTHDRTLERPHTKEHKHHDHQKHKNEKHSKNHDEEHHNHSKHKEPKSDNKLSKERHKNRSPYSEDKKIELDKVWREYESGKRYYSQEKDMKKVIDRLDGVERFRREERLRSSDRSHDRSSDTSCEVVRRSRSRERRRRSRSREKHKRESDQDSNHSSNWQYSLTRIEARQEQCTTDIDTARRSIEHRIKLLEMRFEKQYSSSERLPEKPYEKPNTKPNTGEPRDFKKIIDQVADECREVTRTLEVRTEEMNSEIASVVRDELTQLDEKLNTPFTPSSPGSCSGVGVVGNFRCEETIMMNPIKGGRDDDRSKLAASVTSVGPISSADESMVTVIEENSRATRNSPKEGVTTEAHSPSPSRDSQVRVSQSGALDTLNEPIGQKNSISSTCDSGISADHSSSPLHLRSPGIENLHELSLESFEDEARYDGSHEQAEDEEHNCTGTQESIQIEYRRKIKETEARCQERAIVEKDILYRRINELESMLLAKRDGKGQYV